MAKEQLLILRRWFAYQAVRLAALPVFRAGLRHALIGLSVVCEIFGAISTAGLPYRRFTALMRSLIEGLLSNRYHFDTIL